MDGATVRSPIRPIWSILLFLHFSKIRGHIQYHTRSKQNYESDPAEILAVAVYETVLHNSKLLLRLLVKFSLINKQIQL